MQTNHVVLLLCSIFCFVKSDPDPIYDYCVADTKNPRNLFLNEVPCINPDHASSSHFATSALSEPGDGVDKQRFSVTFTDVNNLPGLNTFGLVLARTDIAANGLVPPHSHPRASELVIVLEGLLLVGFVDSSNRIYRQQLSPGDCFVIPKSLVHFLYNVNSDKPAVALSGLNSQNPGGQRPSLARFRSYSDPTFPVGNLGEWDYDQWSGLT
ncbi:germin-like protein subfamily 1 member 1 [Andrographis paniculata]|uniref:germin-like protein subfamily 1 member 1 n=1 Tax=Andrographis paniculata TaxID=175694 RepID=UPI0021E71A5E|nr:germin-like protein subfamily 1 member 1 [Andrographis paniculata]